MQALAGAMKRKLALKSAWVLCLALAVLFLGGDAFGGGGPISQLARPYTFSVVSWEVDALPKKWFFDARTVLFGTPSQDQQVATVRRYFELADESNDLRGQLDVIVAGLNPNTDRRQVEQGLARVDAQRASMELSVERTIETMISTVLKDEGLTSKFMGVTSVWPPVDFRLSDVPRVLIVSPRDRIEVAETHLLSPGMTLGQTDALEREIDQRGLSSLVERIGGVATYPSLIPDSGSLRFTLQVASHEWTHHYLFFHPLGRSYWSTAAMTTINETVADYVGRAIGDEVYRRFFATLEELNPQPTLVPAASPASVTRPVFSFNAEMRETRLKAEQMLADGKVDQAEAYMESRRLFMGDHGYVIRKLNQAYFAFHGSYADQPQSSSPIGGQLQAVRQRYASLRDFLHRVSRYQSYDDLKRDLSGPGIAQPGI